MVNIWCCHLSLGKLLSESSKLSLKSSNCLLLVCKFLFVILNLALGSVDESASLTIICRNLSICLIKLLLQSGQADLHGLKVLLLLMHCAGKLLLVRDQLNDSRLLFGFELKNDLLELFKAVVQVNLTLATLVRARLACSADRLCSAILKRFII